MVFDGAGFSIPNGVFLAKSPHNFRALVALEPLVSLMSWFGACSARISGDRHTQTDTQTKYRNPRCACAPRVKKINSGGPSHIVEIVLWMILVCIVSCEALQVSSCKRLSQFSLEYAWNSLVFNLPVGV